MTTFINQSTLMDTLPRKSPTIYSFSIDLTYLYYRILFFPNFFVLLKPNLLFMYSTISLLLCLYVSLSLYTAWVRDMQGKEIKGVSDTKETKRRARVLTKELLITCLPKNKQKSESTILNHISKLTHLHLENKQINQIPVEEHPNLLHCKELRSLYLHENQLTDISTLRFPKLTHLYLQNNLMESFTADSKLPRLEKLYIDNNSIQLIDGEFQPYFGELYASSQKGQAPLQFSTSALQSLSINLAVLHLSHNRLTDLSPYFGLQSLVVANFANNDISDLNAVATFMQQCPQLMEADFSGNPVSKLRPYRKTLLLASRSLQTLDKKPIAQAERLSLQRFASHKYKQHQLGQQRLQAARDREAKAQAESQYAEQMYLAQQQQYNQRNAYIPAMPESFEYSQAPEMSMASQHHPQNQPQQPNYVQVFVDQDQQQLPPRAETGVESWRDTPQPQQQPTQQGQGGPGQENQPHSQNGLRRGSSGSFNGNGSRRGSIPGVGKVATSSGRVGSRGSSRGSRRGSIPKGQALVSNTSAFGEVNDSLDQYAAQQEQQAREMSSRNASRRTSIPRVSSSKSGGRRGSNGSNNSLSNSRRGSYNSSQIMF